MRPLKPYVLALSGLIAAVFSAVFLGANTASRLTAPVATPQSDLQADRSTRTTDLVAGRAAQAERKAPAPQPHVPLFSTLPGEAATARLARGLAFEPTRRGRELLADQRQHLLVGVVELRI